MAKSREEIREYNRAYHAARKADPNRPVRTWTKHASPEAAAAARKAKRKANPSTRYAGLSDEARRAVIEKTRAWQAANPDKVAGYQDTRNAKVRARTDAVIKIAKRLSDDARKEYGDWLRLLALDDSYLDGALRQYGVDSLVGADN